MAGAAIQSQVLLHGVCVGRGRSGWASLVTKTPCRRIKHQRHTHLFSEEVDLLRVYLGDALWFGDLDEGLEDRELV